MQYLPLLVSVIGWLALPIITLIVNKNGEKNRLEHQYRTSMNGLNEKWMSYLRDDAEDFVRLCHQYASVKSAKAQMVNSEYKTKNPRLWEDMTRDLAGKELELEAFIEAKESKMAFLFKPKSRSRENLIEPMKTMTDAAILGNRIAVRESEIKFRNAIVGILDEKWKAIEHQLK